MPTERSRRQAICPLPLVVWLGVALLSAAPLFAEIIDRVMAVANGDLILLSDVRAAQSLGLVDVGSDQDPTRAILARLIDRALVLDEVNRYAPPEPEPEAIDDELTIVRARFRSTAEFEQVLRRLGVAEPQLRETLRQNLRIRAYLDQRFAGDGPDHAQTAIAEWMAGLRRRAEILNLN